MPGEGSTAGLEKVVDVDGLITHWTAAHRQAAARALDAYEAMLVGLTIAEAQAAFGRQLANAYFGSARRLLELDGAD